MQPRFQCPQRRLLLRELEQQLLVFPPAEAASQSHRADVSLAPSCCDSKLELPAPGVESPTEASCREVVIVDPASKAFEAVVVHLAGDRAREVLMLVLDRSEDALIQIQQFLHRQTDVKTVHLVGLGEAGSFRLGNVTLDAASLGGHAGVIASWGCALSSTAQLVLSGYESGSSEDGRFLAESLAALTGASVILGDSDDRQVDQQGTSTARIPNTMFVIDDQRVSQPNAIPEFNPVIGVVRPEANKIRFANTGIADTSMPRRSDDLAAETMTSSLSTVTTNIDSRAARESHCTMMVVADETESQLQLSCEQLDGAVLSHFTIRPMQAEQSVSVENVLAVRVTDLAVVCMPASEIIVADLGSLPIGPVSLVAACSGPDASVLYDRATSSTMIRPAEAADCGTPVRRILAVNGGQWTEVLTTVGADADTTKISVTGGNPPLLLDTGSRRATNSQDESCQSRPAEKVIACPPIDVMTDPFGETPESLRMVDVVVADQRRIPVCAITRASLAPYRRPEAFDPDSTIIARPESVAGDLSTTAVVMLPTGTNEPALEELLMDTPESRGCEGDDRSTANDSVEIAADTWQVARADAPAPQDAVGETMVGLVAPGAALLVWTYAGRGDHLVSATMTHDFGGNLVGSIIGLSSGDRSLQVPVESIDTILSFSTENRWSTWNSAPSPDDEGANVSRSITRETAACEEAEGIILSAHDAHSVSTAPSGLRSRMPRIPSKRNCWVRNVAETSCVESLMP